MLGFRVNMKLEVWISREENLEILKLNQTSIRILYQILDPSNFVSYWFSSFYVPFCSSSTEEFFSISISN